MVRLVLPLLLCLIAVRPVSAEDAHPAPETAAGKNLPSRIEVGYDVLKSGIRAASITEVFTRDKNGYRLESISKAEGLLALLKPETITVTSTGSITAQGLRPVAFTNQRKLDSDRNSRADFDWTEKRLTLNDAAGKRSVPLPEDTQDRLSAMYQFMFAPLKNTATYDFHMTNGSKVDIYNYSITPGQSVTVPLGTFKALYVTNSPRENESRTEIWLATERWNFPCKMVITDPDGDKFIQELTRFDFVP